MNLHSQSCIPTLHPKTEDIVLMYLRNSCQFILTNHFHNDIFQKEWKIKTSQNYMLLLKIQIICILHFPHEGPICEQHRNAE